MRKLFVVLMLVSACHMGNSQEMVYKAWERCAVNIQCVMDTIPFDKIGDLSVPIRKLRFNGTAVFVKYKRHLFLITARHLLYDKYKAEMIRQHQQDTNLSRQEKIYYEYYSQKDLDELVCSHVFVIPKVEQWLKTGNSRSKLKLGSIGIPALKIVSFDTANDLAVISLGREYGAQIFTKYLKEEGYIPMKIDSLADIGKIGNDVFTVGFPGATSQLGNKRITESEKNWNSSTVAVPIFSWGKIAMSSPYLNFIWCDMSVYPGNSGGAVIMKNKLIGIVSAQGSINIDGSDLKTRIPYAQVIKISKVIPLLEEHIKIENSDIMKQSFPMYPMKY